MGLPAWDPIRGYGVKDSDSTGVFGFSTVVLKLIMDRWAPKQVELAKKLGQVIITDVDDYYQGLTPANLAYDLTHPDKNDRANREYYAQTVDNADIIVVSTPFLYDFHSKTHPHVYLVRNGVNMQQFEKRKPRNTKPVLGWTGSVSFRNNDLEQLREWLPDFMEEHDLTFHHAGHDPNSTPISEIIGVPERRITTSPLVTINEYADGFQFDIGVVPLSDIPFNHAKSNIKGLEYAAAGIPFIASDLPEYRLLHEAGVGRIATTPEEWRKNCTELLNYSTRKQESARSWDTVSRNFSIQSRAEDWKKVFTSGVESIQQQRRYQNQQA
jgi:glycosyltransferase involved in cell wall biosynthesis